MADPTLADEVIYKAVKDFIIPIAGWGITLFLGLRIQRKIIPVIQAEALLKKQTFDFHEKYMKLSDRISKAKLMFGFEYQNTSFSYSILTNQINGTVKNSKVSSSEFENFKEQRRKFYESRVEYIASIQALIYLYFEEVRYIKEDFPTIISSVSRRKMYRIFLEWIESTVTEV